MHVSLSPADLTFSAKVASDGLVRPWGSYCIALPPNMQPGHLFLTKDLTWSCGFLTVPSDLLEARPTTEEMTPIRQEGVRCNVSHLGSDLERPGCKRGIIYSPRAHPRFLMFHRAKRRHSPYNARLSAGGGTRGLLTSVASL